MRANSPTGIKIKGKNIYQGYLIWALIDIYILQLVKRILKFLCLTQS